MADQVDQIAQAILVASDPTQIQLHPQALAFIQSAFKDSSDSWRTALALILDVNPDGSRKHHPQVRFYALRVLDDFLDNSFDPLPPDVFTPLRQAILEYIQNEYVLGNAEANAPYIRNKFSHTLTLVFLRSYLDQWPDFFSDLFSLIQAQSSSSAPVFNTHVSLLLFHLVIEISEEVADQILKAARTFTQQRHFRDGKVRDAVRERDAARINEAVLTIVADSAEKLNRARKGEISENPDRLVEVVDWGIRTFGSYVGWIDINLTITPTSIPLIFSLLSDPSLPIRLATSAALLRIVSKGLKEPANKLSLLKVLSLGPILEALEQKTREQQIQRGTDIDEGEESYREALGRLLNIVGLELAKLTEDATNAPDEVKAEAGQMLTELQPVLLKFLADTFDDTTSTVFPLLSSILLMLKKVKRSSPQEITEDIRSFLSSTITTLLEKMKWDEDSNIDDMDEDDKHTFESFRKGDLRSQLDSISIIDQDLVINIIRTLVMNTIAAYESGTTIKWTDAELAIYLIYIYGEISKSGGKGRAAFCQAPPLAKEQRKGTDYSEYPLTAHGEMLMALIRSNICTYPNDAVTMQFFETCARYGDFFKVRKECVVPLLSAMVGPKGVHHPNVNVRSRVFYLFYKFIKDDRNEIPVEVVVSLLNDIRDVLAIEVTLPELDNPAEQDLLTETINAAGVFDKQLYLFESVGLLDSLLFKNQEETYSVLQSFVQPLLDELESNLKAIKNEQDVTHIVKVHHVMMALGSIAKGFPDLPQPIPEGYILPPIPIFRHMTQAIVVSLGAMCVFKPVRDAARFAFARMVATAGAALTDFIPAFMDSLLAHFAPTELVDFMNFLGLLMHRLAGAGTIAGVVAQLISPLHARLTALLSAPVTGTDDRVARSDAARAYLTFLSNVLQNGLSGVFLADDASANVHNRAELESILECVLGLAEGGEGADPTVQRLAFAFLGRCVGVWGPQLQAEGSGTVPGFERLIYDRLVPLAFQVPSSQSFNLRDGQILVVCHEIANLLQIIAKARGDEALQFLGGSYLPAQGCPPETAQDFATKLRELDQKGFRKYFVEFVKASKAVGEGS